MSLLLADLFAEVRNHPTALRCRRVGAVHSIKLLGSGTSQPPGLLHPHQRTLPYAGSSRSDGVSSLRIGTKADASNGVLVTVRDTGPGLRPNDADRLFEAFYTTKPMGMGMGLSISRSIIEDHGGRLWASANVPRGAIFQFTVPAHSDGES